MQQAPLRRDIDRGNTLAETAEALRLSIATVRRQISSGKIKAVKVSERRRVVTDAEIARILSGQAAR